jgi:hypothetical protein
MPEDGEPRSGSLAALASHHATIPLWSVACNRPRGW